jgi:hypothetical protein
MGWREWRFKEAVAFLKKSDAKNFWPSEPGAKHARGLLFVHKKKKPSLP